MYDKTFLAPSRAGRRPGHHATRSISLVACLLALSGYANTAGATLIHVDTAEQKTSGLDGCSLQEAIWAANIGDSKAILVGAGNTVTLINTECVLEDDGSPAYTIILPGHETFSMSGIVDDPFNYVGPTATPIVLADIVIEANGAVIQHAPNNVFFRAFAVGVASFATGQPLQPGRGALTIRNAHIRGFAVKGGDGAYGGGGGLGAGGAVYVHGGSLTVENSTFEANSVYGGNGSRNVLNTGGGGGGLSGNGNRAGEPPQETGFDQGGGGGGGGGARGDGGAGESDCGSPCLGIGAPGGGGGGRGSLFAVDPSQLGGNGGDGDYGGGGGCGAGLLAAGDGGRGGFGGGGGAAYPDHNPPPYLCSPDDGDGGGGAGLGGAIFNHSGSVIVRNSTFTRNSAARGVSASWPNSQEEAHSGQDQGGAIFSVGGALVVLNSTVYVNDGTSPTNGGSGIVVYAPGFDVFSPIPQVPPTYFELRNTIIAGNTAGGAVTKECRLINSDSNSVQFVGSGNLITANDNCASGLVSSDDPLLEGLQLNPPGLTPTFALSAESPAIDVAGK